MTLLIIAIPTCVVVLLAACMCVMAVTRLADYWAAEHIDYVTPDPEIPGDTAAKQRNRMVAAERFARRV